MPVESIFFLGLVIGALVVFSAVLSYAECASRAAEREIGSRNASSAKPYSSRPTEMPIQRKAA